MKKIRIGGGAGYSGDRVEPSIELIEKGNLDYIAYECLAERTIAIAQQIKMSDPSKGYDGLLEYRMERALSAAYKNKVKIITNMGAANPLGALEVVKKIAETQNLKGLKIAAVIGDDVLSHLDEYQEITVWETGEPLKSLEGTVVSANAYLGISGILKALEQGADVVITGRVSDPALYLAPLVHEFGWKMDDFEKMGKGTLVGHLLECGGQVTGGYYADPGKKDVFEPWNIGFPIAEVDEYGDATISKVEGTGGMVTEDTCKEQMIYEIHDPEHYFTPDCVADFSGVTIKAIGKDLVSIKGGSGKPKTDTYKVSIGYKDCFIGEGEMSYGGPNCVARAQLALEIVQKRLEMTAVEYDEIRFDIIGVNALFAGPVAADMADPNEVRIRVTARTKTKDQAVKVANEVETLYTNGPAGGGGATKKVSEVVSVASILVPKKEIKVDVVLKEVM
ncbi:acyclic terpene utilization AtuA family protein [Fusibacter ferrireducens]|uniref:DUF1446 domain-containing protein n=1 Tax=Fusibacter ferrireducens TaxID=2785058 RepID=A0ABR9ZW13_9FIRM|nr:acyclic terpene utilization AtuA family protein [Fusibacter ferrireducens]MBF4694645.1 DUF1446 domain-containing protein [Fusibacter ferrireducens]